MSDSRKDLPPIGKEGAFGYCKTVINYARASGTSWTLGHAQGVLHAFDLAAYFTSDELLALNAELREVEEKAHARAA